MVFAAVFTVAGYFLGAFRAPLIMLLGFIATRGAILVFDGNVKIFAIGLVWIVAAWALGSIGWHKVGFFAALSGLSYPTLFAFGYRIEYMGLLPIVADAFIIAALFFGIGGGLIGLANYRNDGALRSPNDFGMVSGPRYTQVLMEKGEGRSASGLGDNSQNDLK